MSKILIPVAWPYANGPRHIGHVAGFGVPSDVFARYMRATGNEVLMISGTDEHGTPILVQADQEGVTPQELADRYNKVIVNDLYNLGLSYDLFTRTTTQNHTDVVQELFLGLYKNGYIFKEFQKSAIDPRTGRTLPDRYIEGECPICHAQGARGDQCDNCGNQLDPDKLINPKSKIDGATPKFVDSEHFFLDLPALRDSLKKWLETRTDWRPNVIKFSLGLLKDLHPRAITRDIDWGIPIPVEGWEENDHKRLYVWFDAVIGYLSASIEWSRRFGSSKQSSSSSSAKTVLKHSNSPVDLESNSFEPANAEDSWREWWNNPEAESYYFMGKDNITFHSQIWPAELLGYCGLGSKGGEPGKFGELQLPTDIVSSEFLTMEGKKFSSSKHVVIYVKDFLERYQADALRYFISIAGPENQDADFTWQDFYQRTNSELVAGWGNLVNRVANMIAKNFGEIPDYKKLGGDFEDIDNILLDKINNGFNIVGDLIGKNRQQQALRELMSLVGEVNTYISETEPFKLKNDVLGSVEKTQARLATILFVCAQTVVDLNTMFTVFLPHSANKIYEIYGGSEGIDNANGPKTAAAMPIVNNVKDLDNEDFEYPIITGNYQVGVDFLEWKRHNVVTGTKISKPEPVFVKLDPKIVEEELDRLNNQE